MIGVRHLAFALLLVPPVVLVQRAQAQEHAPLLPAERDAGNGLKRTRLYMKDGSYQLVLNYRVVGKNVTYLSAERAGQREEVPLALVDLEATHRWEQRNAETTTPTQMDPELQREEAARAARTPLVAPELHLPDDDSVLALDTYHGQPQLAVLQQTDGELNRQTAHNIIRGVINPLSSAHQVVQIPGERAPVQLHVADPVLFVRLEDRGQDSGDAPSGSLVIDTHGSPDIPHERVSPHSRYVVVRVDVRRGVRVVTSFSINLLGSGKQQSDVVETTSAVLPGGHWLRIAPKESLPFGEYALVEVLDERNINLGVWDFGVHPTAGENRDAILPEPARAPELERRTPRP